MSDLVTRGFLRGHLATSGMYSEVLSTTSTTSSSTSSSTSSTVSSTSSSSSTTTLCQVRHNQLPSQRHSAILRRKHDERVEIRGTPCRLYQYRDISGSVLQYDEFDDPIIHGVKKSARSSRVIIEPYQEPKDITGDVKGQEQLTYPFIGTFRWSDGAQKLDIVEVSYEYAQQAGLSNCNFGEVKGPVNSYYTRFKLVNKRTQGINSDMVLQFFLVPTEEEWT